MYCTDNITINMRFFFSLFLVTVSIAQAFGTDQFSASTSGSYKCNDKTKLVLIDGLEMHTYNLQYAAFQDNITDFSDKSKISVSLLFFPPNFS